MMAAARVTRADVERKASVVRELMRLAAQQERAGDFDTAAQTAGKVAVAALDLSKAYTARAEEARARGGAGA